MKNKLVFILGVSLFLAGCGTPTVDGEVLNPTEAVEPDITATEEIIEPPDEEPEVDEVPGLLPAPLIYLKGDDEGVDPGSQNLWRLEADGVTETQLTDEEVPITGFDVSPVDGAIVYATFSDNDLYRIEADGSRRTLLFDGPEMSIPPEQGRARQLSNLAWSPDGEQISFGLDGIYIIPATGGEPRLLLADEVSGEVLSQADRYYRLLSWSPDGAQILALEGFGYEGAGYAVVNVDDGQVISLGGAIRCCSPSWSLDGESFYFGSQIYGLMEPGLWQADADTGAVTTLIPGFEGEGIPESSSEPMNLFESVQQLGDGNLYAFAARGPYAELFAPNEEGQIATMLTMSRISPDGSSVEPIRSDSYMVAEALWAEDASGAVIVSLGNMLWLKSDGSEPVVLGGLSFFPKWGAGPPLVATEGPEPRYGVELSSTLAGLTYSDEEGLWVVEPDGRSRFLIDQPGAAISPDGTKVLYEFGDVSDIWLADLVTGEKRNLTNTSERREGEPQWWEARPDVIVFESKSVEQELFGYGNPTIVNLDGSGYQVLDEERAGPVDPSPDGQRLAYGCCGETGTIYDLAVGPSTFDPADYGANAVEKVFIPAWSPGGSQLAWKVSGSLVLDQPQIGFGIFDLEEKTSVLRHVYSVIGGGTFPHYLTWSPDGEWLAIVTFGERPELGRQPALYVLRVDGTAEHYLGVGFDPVWSPDGRWLAFNNAKETMENLWDFQAFVVEKGDWDNLTLLPVDADVEDWIDQ
ncbi:MAG: hypothetical protein GTO18_14600 [Anaerolineales bacterium]|nr:hypothetical protein [Anaerolineales bacterium]